MNWGLTPIALASIALPPAASHAREMRFMDQQCKALLCVGQALLSALMYPQTSAMLSKSAEAREKQRKQRELSAKKFNETFPRRRDGGKFTDAEIARECRTERQAVSNWRRGGPYGKDKIEVFVRLSGKPYSYWMSGKASAEVIPIPRPALVTAERDARLRALLSRISAYAGQLEQFYGYLDGMINHFERELKRLERSPKRQRSQRADPALPPQRSAKR